MDLVLLLQLTEEVEDEAREGEDIKDLHLDIYYNHLPTLLC